MITKAEAETRVARGAAYLDSKWPEWAQHINTDALDMGSSCSCVLGQMTGDYNTAIRNLWPESMWGRVVSACNDLYPRADRTSEALGFDAPDSDFELERDVDYRRLQDAWIEAIADRRLSTTPNGTPAAVAVPVRPTAQMNVCSRT